MFDNFANLKLRVGRNIGIIGDSTYDTKIGHWINETYEDIWDSFLWPASLYRDTVTTIVNQDYVTMPQRCKRVLLISQQTTPTWMRFRSSAEFVREFYQSLDSTSTGTPQDIAVDGEVSVMAQPTSASILTVVSSSAGDTAQTVRCFGRNANGVLISESIQLNGVTTVPGSTSFTTVEQINKSATTTGIVTVTSNAAAVTLARIAPLELSMKVISVRLHLIPDTAITLYVIGKDKVIKLVNDDDLPKLDADRAIVAGTTALALREQGDSESEVWAQRASNILTRQRNEILGQGAYNMRLTVDVPRRYNIRATRR